MPAIGIDLGTTNSCVAVWQNDRIQIIPNNQGKRTTPSYVAFTNNECLVGAPAKNQASKNSLNTIFDAKRLIGRNYNDPDIQSDIKQWPFKVINVDGKPKIKIQLNDKEEEYEPEKISSLILIKMKEIAETFLGEPVKDAVITVPAYFNDSQRKATRDAGKLAGLNVLRIINEPTAAALAYGIDKELTGKKNVLVYDIGGGTTDVSILTITDGSKFEVKSTSGDTHLGGEDFDSKLVDHFCEEFYRKNKINIKDKSRSLRRLRAAAVNAKQDLSSSGEALIEIDSLCDGIDFTTTITKTEFERVCNDLFVAALKPVDDAINGAKINKMLIDDILLVGGTTRIPKIQALLQNYFCGKPLNFTINPDEAVAFGAAIQAEMLVNNEYKSSRIKNMKLIDVTGHSLGVGTGEHTMMFFIPRNKKIPCKKTQLMQTFLDNQTDVIFPIYEGEDDDIRNNRLLGEFELNGIPPAKAGTEILQVTFNLDADGILHVTAINKKTGLSNEIKINRDKGNLSSEEFKKRLSEIEKFKIKEKLQQEAAAERYKIETYILSLINTIEDSSCKLSLEKKNQVLEICSDANCWLKRNRGEDKVIYISKMEEVTGLCTLIMASE